MPLRISPSLHPGEPPLARTQQEGAWLQLCEQDGWEGAGGGEQERKQIPDPGGVFPAGPGCSAPASDSSLSKERGSQEQGDFSIWTMSGSCLVQARRGGGGVGVGAQGCIGG